MKFNFSKNLGFTLVELLVVIAIIGILSSVAVVNLNSARDKARIAALQETLAGLRPVIFLCLSNEQSILCGETNDPCNLTIYPYPNQIVCNNSDVNWPDIETQYPGWQYCVTSQDISTGEYRLAVTNGNQRDCTVGTEIFCDQNTCGIINH